MYYKEMYKEVSKPDNIPNPRAPILGMYMDEYHCDIVTAYNIRMKELWNYYESEKVRLTSPYFDEEMKALSQRHAHEQIGMILSLKPNMPPKEMQEVVKETNEKFQKSLERKLHERDEYVKNVLTPPNKNEDSRI